MLNYFSSVIFLSQMHSFRNRVRRSLTQSKKLSGECISGRRNFVTSQIYDETSRGTRISKITMEE